MSTCAAIPAVSRALQLLADRRDLEAELAAEVLERIMQGDVGEVQAAAFLMGLRVKGASAPEIAGLVETMRRRAEPVEVESSATLVDTCGTGGDGLGTFNISTTAAFVAAGAGVRVAKHGNRGATSRSGSADLLEALGVCIELSPAGVAACIAEAGVGFMFAPLHHRAMRHLAPIRRALGVSTVFNFLGPLANPAGAKRQLVGVSDARYVTPMAEAMACLGAERALVVHGRDGLDEISVCEGSVVTEVADGAVLGSWTVTPEELGLQRSSLDDLRGGDPLTNAGITRAVLSGQAGAPLDVTLANAGAALYVAGAAGSLAQGVARARESVASGRAQAKLEALVKASRKAAGQSPGGTP